MMISLFSLFLVYCLFHSLLFIDSAEYQLCYVNGEVSDIDTRLQDNASVDYIPCPMKDDAMFSRDKQTKDYFKTMWHSSTHILAYALEQYYGDKIQLIHGPPGEGVPYCFFYEVTLSVGFCFVLSIIREMLQLIKISRTFKS